MQATCHAIRFVLMLMTLMPAGLHASDLCLSVCDSDARACRKQIEQDSTSLRPLGIPGLLLGNRNATEPYQNPAIAMQQGIPDTNPGSSSLEAAQNVERLQDCEVARQSCLDGCAADQLPDALPGPQTNPLPTPLPDPGAR